MADDKVENTAFLADSDKTSLGALDIFDRVINLKLTVRNPETSQEEEYIIRSDFEFYYPELVKAVGEDDFNSFSNVRKGYIRKCQFKPSIRVNYKRVSMSTPVSIDIYINNFFMLDKSGKMLKNFNARNNRLVKVELAMGYYGQFASMLVNKATNEIDVNALFDFSPEKHTKNGISVITIADVSYVQTDKLPPDMTIHVHGFAGTFYNIKLDELTVEKGLPANYEDIVSKGYLIDYSTKTDSTDVTYLGRYFFNNLTRYFTVLESLPKEVKLDSNGRMSEDDAKKYGVKVFFSNGMQKYAEEYDKTHLKTKDKDGNIINNWLGKAGAQPSAESQMNYIKNFFGMKGKVDAVTIMQGHYLLFMKDEFSSVDTLLKNTALEAEYLKDAVSVYWKDKLPAVYNIAVDALCTITCPFFFFTNPFQKFYFKSRYALGGLVGYFADMNATEDEFYALWQNVSFATVDDVNECTIVCTGKRS